MASTNALSVRNDSPGSVVTCNNLCRICLLRSPKPTSLMDRVDGVMIPEMLYKLCGRQIEVQEGYPRSICPRCLCLLECAYKFLNEFHQQDETLRGFYWSGAVEARLQEYQDNEGLSVEKRMDELFNRSKGSPPVPPTKDTVSRETNTDPHPVLVDASTITDRMKIVDIDSNVVKAEVEGEYEPLEDYIVEEEEEAYTAFDDAGFRDETLVAMKIDVLETVDPNQEGKTRVRQRRKKSGRLSVRQGSRPKQRAIKAERYKPYTDTDDVSSGQHDEDNFENLDGTQQVKRQAIAVEENQESESADVYQCDECEREFTDFRSWKIHVKRHVPVPTIAYGCSLCQKTFNSKARLQRHYRLHAGNGWYEKKWNAQKEKRDMKYSCETCDNTYPTKRKLESHKAAEHLSPQELEELKAKKMKPKRSMSKLKDNRCPYPGCDYEAKTYGAMYVHKRSKHIPVHRCEVCEKTFAFQNQLKVHMNLHTGEKPFHCDICGRQFRRAFSYREHMEMHNADANYTCTICNKSFKRPRYLQAHVLTHDNQRKFSCAICGSSYKTNGELTKHFKNKHSFEEMKDSMTESVIEVEEPNVSYVVEYI